MSLDLIREYIEKLDQTLGPKEAVSFRPLEKIHRRQDYSALCVAIGAHMGMPNAVQITFSSTNERFTTRALSTTGHGSQGIVAQVQIPRNLPLYGTVAFQSHVIEMMLGSDFRAASAPTAVALLAHELSHILLHALRHPERDSEKLTDLVPLFLGFGDVVAHGRTRHTREEHGNIVSTTKTTYGYLSDPEFAFARHLVSLRLAQSRQTRGALSARLFDLEREIGHMTRLRNTLKGLLEVLDGCGTFASAADGPRLVAFHDPGHFDSLSTELAECRNIATEARAFLSGLLRPSANEASRVERFTLGVARALDHARKIATTLDSDISCTLRNLPAGPRVRWTALSLGSRLLGRLPRIALRAV